METGYYQKDLRSLVTELNLKQKIDRALDLLREAYKAYGNSLVVANSLGKDSMAVWDLAKKVNPGIRGFIVTTRYKPKETVQFMNRLITQYPELRVYKNDEQIPEDLYRTDPDRCCYLLKVLPVRWAIKEMSARCWVTGLRCTEGRTRTDFRETEERDKDLPLSRYPVPADRQRLRPEGPGRGLKSFSGAIHRSGYRGCGLHRHRDCVSQPGG